MYSAASTSSFDPVAFLNELMAKMSLENIEEPVKTELREAMAANLHHDLFQAASNYVEPEVIDAVMTELSEEPDAWTLLTELVNRSPGAQVAVLEAIRDFETRVLSTYEEITQ